MFELSLSSLYFNCKMRKEDWKNMKNEEMKLMHQQQKSQKGSIQERIGALVKGALKASCLLSGVKCICSFIEAYQSKMISSRVITT